MTPKLTQPMRDAILGATYVRIDDQHHYFVLYGVKTVTAKALWRRGLVVTPMVGAFREYVLNWSGINMKASMEAARDAEVGQTIIAANTDATIADADADAAEASLAAHMANAWSDDITRADGDGPIYLASRAALLDNIRTAYPDVDAQMIYDYCSESGESVAHCVEYWRAERKAIEEEEAEVAAEEAAAMQAYIFDVTFVDEPFTASLPVLAGSEVEARRTVREYFADGAWGILATITLTNRTPLVHVLDITPGMVILTATGARIEVAEVTADAFGVYLTPPTGQTRYVSTGTMCAQIGSFNLG